MTPPTPRCWRPVDPGLVAAEGWPAAVPFDGDLGPAFAFTEGLPGFIPGVFITLLADGSPTYQGGPGFRYKLDEVPDVD